MKELKLQSWRGEGCVGLICGNCHIVHHLTKGNCKNSCRKVSQEIKCKFSFRFSHRNTLAKPKSLRVKVTNCEKVFPFFLLGSRCPNSIPKGSSKDKTKGKVPGSKDTLSFNKATWGASCVIYGGVFESYCFLMASHCAIMIYDSFSNSDIVVIIDPLTHSMTSRFDFTTHFVFHPRM